MGVSNSPDILQHKMNDLFQVFEFIHTYIDELLVLTILYWMDHLSKLEKTLNKLKESGMKFNIENSFLGQTKMEYLCFWVTVNVIKPLDKK